MPADEEAIADATVHILPAQRRRSPAGDTRHHRCAGRRSRCTARQRRRGDRRGLVQPGNNADAFRDARRGQDQSITFAAPADRVLIQSEGEAWRQMRNGPITGYGGWALVVVSRAGGLLRDPRRDQARGQAHRQTHGALQFIERLAHWSLASTFVILALTGICMLCSASTCCCC